MPRTFGENLQAAMRKAGMSRVALARALGVTEPQIDKWLTATNVELQTLFRLAKALQVSIESLVERLDPEYDAMRVARRGPDDLYELWSRLPVSVRASLWQVLASVADSILVEPPDTPPRSQ